MAGTICPEAASGVTSEGDAARKLNEEMRA
jgi:hypothetical protein